MSDDFIRIEAEVTSPRVNAQVGAIWQGAPGRGFVNIVHYWLATNLMPNEVDTGTPGWTESPQWLDASKTKLYRYDRIYWTAEPMETIVEPVLVGVWNTNSMPAGGTDGQFLVKDTNADFVTRWEDPPSQFKKYGVRRILNATSPTLLRIHDSVGLSAPNVPAGNVEYINDFDNIYPWSHIRNCKILSNGRIYYESDPGYELIIDCDWMVEIPLYYLNITQTETYRDILISQYKHPNYWVPNFFKKEDGSICDKIYIARFKTTTVDDVDVSRPDSFLFNLRHLASFRTDARAKGAGWQLTDISWVGEGLHPLYMIESATLNSQTWLGVGVTSVPYVDTDISLLTETSTNRIVVSPTVAAKYNIGELVNIGTSLGSSTVARFRYILEKNIINSEQTELILNGDSFNISEGNVIWIGCIPTGSTLNLTNPCARVNGISGRSSNKYRCMEDVFGNAYEWVDGILINNGVSYVNRKPNTYSSTLTDSYKPVSYTNHNESGYSLEMGFDHNYPELQTPITIGAGTSTGYCDYYYYATGLRGAYFGGYSAGGAVAGLFYWVLNAAPSYSAWRIGSRLLFKP